MSRYLEEAAELLRKASESNEKRYAGPHDGRWLNEGRERIARDFAALAAIDKGLVSDAATESVLERIRQAGDQ